MKNHRIIPGLVLFFSLWILGSCHKTDSSVSKDERMAWWREARFGLFIHWGLYAIPAGEWNGTTTYGEWIRHSAQIPLQEYDQFVNQFNPLQFDADAWVQLAKDAGMKYIVITSKHHDGFGLFDSKYTGFDIMSTPFRRDILKELATACHEAGIKICWYHSIMDWHHPDYLPRREWESDRTAEGADFDRYIYYMKSQLSELLSNYGEIGVLWFDGEWESTWTHSYGMDLYKYVLDLQPSIIINNRVDVNRGGMAGISTDDRNVGDFGTPEQQIPSAGLPGIDWETCMTMNDHWGYDKNDHNWKSTKQLLQMLADIASKGGNFLLNVGPTAEGLFPQPSIERLHQMGQWMKVNGEAIYGSQASSFKNLEWGRCTQKSFAENTRLYLHVFDWPKDGKLIVPGIFNEARQAYLLADKKMNQLDIRRQEDALVIDLPAAAPDTINSVIVLDITGKPDIANPPVITAAFNEFVNELSVNLTTERDNVLIRYTLDGTEPIPESPQFIEPIVLKESTVLAARCFRDEKAVSGTVKKEFKKVKPVPFFSPENTQPGLYYRYFEGDWDNLPDFTTLPPVTEGVIANFSITPRLQEEHFGFVFEGFIQIPSTGMYQFYTISDDGSQLMIADHLVVNNDGLHGAEEKSGSIALSEGFHPLRVTFFEKSGGNELTVLYRSEDGEKKKIPDEVLVY